MPDFYLSRSDGLGGVICGCLNAECCLFPAYGFDEFLRDEFNPSGPVRPDTDLPDNLIIGGLTISKNAGFITWGDEENGYYVDLEPSFAWRTRFDGGILSGGGFCLIRNADGLSIEDDFSDTYLVDGVTTITRITDCKWTGVDNILIYDNTQSAWYLNGVIKDDPQSSPVGDYGLIVVS